MDATFWSLVGLVIFIGLVLYLKVPAMVTKSLDERAGKIRDELEEARKLREEAQALLAEYQTRRKQAEEEAQGIVEAAKKEAVAMAAEAEQKTADFVKRRTALAEQKIEQAEASAVAEVRGLAVDRAVAAAQELIGGKMTVKTSDQLFKDGLAEIKSKLN